MSKRATHFGCALTVMTLLDIGMTILGGKATAVSMFEMIVASFIVTWLFEGGA